MSERLFLAATSVSIALLLGVFGYLIRERRMLHLVAGYDPSHVEDKAGLAGFVGGYCFLLALLTLANGVADYSFGFGPIRWSVWTVAVLSITVRLIVGAGQYESD